MPSESLEKFPSNHIQAIATGADRRQSLKRFSIIWIQSHLAFAPMVDLANAQNIHHSVVVVDSHSKWMHNFPAARRSAGTSGGPGEHSLRTRGCQTRPKAGPVSQSPAWADTRPTCSPIYAYIHACKHTDFFVVISWHCRHHNCRGNTGRQELKYLYHTFTCITTIGRRRNP